MYNFSSFLTPPSLFDAFENTLNKLIVNDSNLDIFKLLPE